MNLQQTLVSPMVGLLDASAKKYEPMRSQRSHRYSWLCHFRNVKNYCSVKLL